MTVALVSTARRLAVFVLSHAPYCAALGSCSCARRRDGTLLAGSLTVPARARVPDLPDAVLAVPAIALAVREGSLRIEHSPASEPVPDVLHEGGPEAPRPLRSRCSMSVELLSSRVVVVEEEPRVRGIPSAPTSVAAAIGVTQRGPIDVAVLCSSFDEFEGRFGRFTPDADLALAALGFFENGGTQLWCVRTSHHKSVDDPNTATAVRAAAYLTSPGAPTPARATGAAPAPFVLDDGAALMMSVGGGPDLTATISATAALVAAGGPGPYALADGQTLGVRIDGGAPQQVAFAAMDFGAIGSATPAEVAVSLNAKLVGAKAVVIAGVPRIVSDTKGSASRVEITGGTANAALAFPTVPALGKGNVANARATTIDEVKAIAEPAIAGIVVSAAPGGFLDVHTVATGATAQLQVPSATAAAFGLDTTPHAGSASGAANALRVEGKDPGAYANHIEIEVRAPASGAACACDLAVIEDGTYREVFPDLRMTPKADRYVERVINDAAAGSALIRVTDQLLAGSSALALQTVTLSDGDDGLVGLADTDFTGSATGRTGLHAFDRIQDISLLLVPGCATPAVQNAMLRYCEVDRDETMFAVLDPPAGASAIDVITYVETTAALLGLSEFGSMYWPRVKILNPDRGVFGAQDKIVVPPSGIVAGVYARTDAARPGEVYDPPAGIDAGRLFGVLGFETDEVLEERKRDLVYPKRINPLTTGPGLPRYIDGSRTLKGDGNFPYVGERRGVIFIERSLKQGLQFARHKNNTEGLRATVRRTIDYCVPPRADKQRRVPLARTGQGVLRRCLRFAEYADRDLRRQAARARRPRRALGRRRRRRRRSAARRASQRACTRRGSGARRTACRRSGWPDARRPVRPRRS